MLSVWGEDRGGRRRGRGEGEGEGWGGGGGAEPNAECSSSEHLAISATWPWEGLRNTQFIFTCNYYVLRLFEGHRLGPSLFSWGGEEGDILESFG